MYNENEKVLGEETFQMFPIDRKHQYFTLYVFEHVGIKTQYIFDDVWSNIECYEFGVHQWFLLGFVLE